MYYFITVTFWVDETITERMETENIIVYGETYIEAISKALDYYDEDNIEVITAKALTGSEFALRIPDDIVDEIVQTNTL